MKTKIASIYTFLAVMILSIGISSLQAKDDSEKADVRIPLSEETTLVVKYAEQTAGNSESTRFGFFQEAFSAALKDANLSPKVKFIQRGFDKATEGDYFLTVTISTWGTGMRGDYECRFFASISTTEDKTGESLGLFVGREKRFAPGGTNMADEDYVNAARNAVEKLLEHFVSS